MEWSRRLFYMAAVLFGMLMEKISRTQENGRKKTGICVGAVALGQALRACSGSGSGAVHDAAVRELVFAGKEKNGRQMNTVKRNAKEYFQYQKYAEVRKIFKKRRLYKSRDCPEPAG